MTIQFNNSSDRLVLVGKTTADKNKLKSIISLMESQGLYCEREISSSAVIFKLPAIDKGTIESLKIFVNSTTL